ncbi:MAG: hypothetical protein AAB592_01505 [Patescibacteria group bacterium]
MNIKAGALTKSDTAAEVAEFARDKNNRLKLDIIHNACYNYPIVIYRLWFSYMQTAFIKFSPSSGVSVSDFLSRVNSATDVRRVEELHNKNTKNGLGIFFCRLTEGSFQKFKNFITNHFPSDAVVIEEGVKL